MKNYFSRLFFVIKSWPYKNWLVHFITLNHLYTVFDRFVKSKGITFDIGCSDKPYSKLVNLFSNKYFGLEHKFTIHHDNSADLIGSAYHTGLKDESVDTVIATAVLEHLEEPDLAIKEINRILKKDGLVIISAPLFWHVHESPRDFYRYTKYGIKHLFEKNGFETLQIYALSGFWVTFLVMLSNQICRYNRGILKFIPIIPIMVVFLQIIAFVLNRFDYKGDIWTWAYIAVGKKTAD